MDIRAGGGGKGPRSFSLAPIVNKKSAWYSHAARVIALLPLHLDISPTPVGPSWFLWPVQQLITVCDIFSLFIVPKGLVAMRVF